MCQVTGFVQLYLLGGRCEIKLMTITAKLMISMAGLLYILTVFWMVIVKILQY